MADGQVMTEAVEERLSDIAVKLDLLQTMLATTIAIMLRTAAADQRPRILDELRRNVLITLAQVEPTADQAAVLTREDGADRMLDEIARLSLKT